ncbi:MAG: Rpp14/Pop5 family protein [Candidatus Nanohaloarchaea archaeon]
MKQLPPTLRQDQRYLKFQIHSENSVDFSDTVEVIWGSVLGYLGEKDASKANIWIIKNLFDEKKKSGVIRVRSDMVTDLRAALLFIDSINGQKAFISVEKVSGTVKSLED